MTTITLLIPSTTFTKNIINHKPFNEILNTYINKQKIITYKKLKKNKTDLKKFNAYVSTIEKTKIDDEKHSKKARLAFYINAYNTTVIKAVLADIYPDKSNVMDVKDFFDNSKYKITSKTISLNQLNLPTHKINITKKLQTKQLQNKTK